MRVLLVNTNIEKAPYPVPPLGLCLLAGVLEKEHAVKVYDGVFDEGKSLVPLVKEFQPDVIGFSIRNIDDVVADRTIFYPDRILSDFIEPVKKIFPGPVILGGSGFSIFPEELMAMTGADYGIRGEGEYLLPELLRRIQTGETMNGMQNIYSRPSSLVPRPSSFVPRPTSLVPRLTSHISQPLPLSPPPIGGGAGGGGYFDFTPYRQKGVWSIQTKRGCSHGCIYCTYPLIEGKKFRRRTPDAIVDDIEKAHDRLGDITFEFVDSTFNDPKGHAEAICREIIKRKLKLRLRTMGINPRHVSEELFSLMKEAGFMQIDATPDTASPTVLKNIDKGFRLEDIQRMARLIQKFDLPAMWFFLFGGPGETEETVRETERFIKEFINPADMVYLAAGMRVYPGTPLYRVAVEEKLISPDQSILRPSVFYFSPAIGKSRLDEMIEEISGKFHNCLPAARTTPPPEMIAEAIKIRLEQKLTEPMFRTLLRIRKSWFEMGKL